MAYLLVWCLHKTMYGLCQSPHAWNEKINIYLQSIGFVLCFSNPNFYAMIVGDFMFMLIIYVDDLMITRNSVKKKKWFQQLFYEQFDMFLLGPLSLYLVVDFFYNLDNVMLSHCQYLFKCFTNMDLINCVPNSIPKFTIIHGFHHHILSNWCKQDFSCHQHALTLHILLVLWPNSLLFFVRFIWR